MMLDDATLAAFVDGELAPDEAAAVEAAAGGDPALAARIRRLRDLRQGLAGAYDDALTEPPPERLLAAIRAGGSDRDKVVPLAERRRLSPRRLAGWGAMAASLFLAFGAGLAVTRLAPTSPIGAGPAGSLVARGALAVALDRQLASNQAATAPVKIGVSFTATDGRYCRTFLLRGAERLAGLACHDPAGWQIAMAMRTETVVGTAAGYRTAGDETPAPILEAVDATIRGRALDAAEEAGARDAGWGARR